MLKHYRLHDCGCHRQHGKSHAHGNGHGQGRPYSDRHDCHDIQYLHPAPCNCHKQHDTHLSCDCHKQHHPCRCVKPPHIRVRLGGLTDNLMFQLIQKRGCPVKISVQGEGANMFTVEGRIYGAGTDFVDLRLANHTVVTVLMDRIATIHWPEPDCNASDFDGHDCDDDHDDEDK